MWIAYSYKIWLKCTGCMSSSSDEEADDVVDLTKSSDSECESVLERVETR